MNIFPFPYPEEERKSAIAIAYRSDGYVISHYQSPRKLIATTHSTHQVLITNAQTGHLVHVQYSFH